MWVIRGGERDHLVERFIDDALIGVEYPEVPDAEILTRTEIRRFLPKDGSTARLDEQEAVLSAFVREVQVGESVLVLDPRRDEVVVGTVTGRYEFVGDDATDGVHHRRSVEWLARHATSALPTAVQGVVKQRPVLQQHRDAEWSAYLVAIREGTFGKDPQDRGPIRTTARATSTRARKPAAPRVTKPTVTMRTCPSCFLQKHPSNFVGEYCADCAE